MSEEQGSEMVVGIIIAAILFAVLLLAMIMVIDAVIKADASFNGADEFVQYVDNETHYMNTTSPMYFDLNVVNITTVQCTIIIVTNGTGGNTIPSSNYTQNNCRLTNKTTQFSISYWNVSYRYYWTSENTTLQRGVINVQTSVVTGVTNFFDLLPTIGTILAVLVLVGAIVYLVIYVQRMRDAPNTYTG